MIFRFDTIFMQIRVPLPKKKNKIKGNFYISVLVDPYVEGSQGPEKQKGQKKEKNTVLSPYTLDVTGLPWSRKPPGK